MKNLQKKYMALIVALLLIPLISFNLYSDGDDGHGHGHGDGGNEIRATGLITALTTNTLTVDSIEFNVNNHTEIEAHSRSFSFDSLKVGDSVEVRGDSSNSTVVANRIKLFGNGGNGDDHDDHGNHDSTSQHSFEVSGHITLLNDSMLTVRNRMIKITDTTTISFENHNTATKSDLKLDLKVEVRGFMIDSNSFAESIVIEGNESHHNQEFEISGLISSIDSNSFTVDSVTIVVDSATVIVKESVGKIDFSQLKTGDFVEVKGTVDGSSHTALHIEVRNQHSENIEVEGSVTNLSDSTITVESKTFVININTIITREGKGMVDKSELAVGEMVQIKGTFSDSTYIANNIKIENTNNDSISAFEVEGVILSINSATLTVNSTTFSVDSTTLIRSHEHGTLNLSDLTVGMRVEVKGAIINGEYIASMIEVKSSMADSLEINGDITAILDSTFTVNNTVITVTPETLIYDKDGNAITFSDLAVGNFVEVKLSITNNTNFALKINVKKNHRNHDDSAEDSDINMVFSNHILAYNKDYFVDANTKVFNQSGKEISYSELKNGTMAYIVEDIKNNLLYASRIDAKQSLLSDTQTDTQSLINISNEPNPFIESTTLKVNLPEDGIIGCAIYNQAGAKVQDVFYGFVSRGETNFVIDGNSRMVSGIYYLSLIYNSKFYNRAIVKIR